MSACICICRYCAIKCSATYKHSEVCRDHSCRICHFDLLTANPAFCNAWIQGWSIVPDCQLYLVSTYRQSTYFGSSCCAQPSLSNARLKRPLYLPRDSYNTSSLSAAPASDILSDEGRRAYEVQAPAQPKKRSSYTRQMARGNASSLDNSFIRLLEDVLRLSTIHLLECHNFHRADNATCMGAGSDG